MDKFLQISKYIKNIGYDSPLVTDLDFEKEIVELKKLLYEYNNQDLTLKEIEELKRNFYDKYKSLYDAFQVKKRKIKTDANEKELAEKINNIQMQPYKTIRESDIDDIEKFSKLTYDDLINVAEKFGYDYENKNDRAEFLRLVEIRQHDAEFNKAKKGLYGSYASFMLPITDEKLNAEHIKNLAEKDGIIDKDRSNFSNFDKFLTFGGDIGFNILEGLNPFSRFKKVGGHLYNAGLPIARELLTSFAGERDIEALNPLIGTATNYAVPIQLQRTKRRVMRRFDDPSVSDVKRFRDFESKEKSKLRERSKIELARYDDKMDTKIVDLKPLKNGNKIHHYETKVPQDIQLNEYKELKNLETLDPYAFIKDLPQIKKDVKPRLFNKQLIDEDIVKSKAIRSFRERIADSYGDEQAEDVMFLMTEYLRDRTPFFASSYEKLEDGVAKFFRKHPSYFDAAVNYVTNKLGKSTFGENLIGMAGDFAPDFIFDSSKERLDSKLKKNLSPNTLFKKVTKDVSLTDDERDTIQELAKNPQYTLGVGYPLEDRKKYSQIALEYPEIFSQIREKAMNDSKSKNKKEGGK